MKYTIFGLPRSGTFYLQSLFEKNFESITTYVKNKHSDKTWVKHSGNPIYMTPITFFIYKPIYQWVESVSFRNTQFAKFINYRYEYFDKTQFIKTDNDFMMGGYELFYCSLNKMTNVYREFNNRWILNTPSEIKDGFFVINYRDLIDETSRNQTLELINQRFNLGHSGPYLNSDWGTVPFSKEPLRINPDYVLDTTDYYLNNKIKYLNDDHINIIDTVVTSDFIQSIQNKTNSVSPN
jgi:hypothetical protein